MSATTLNSALPDAARAPEPGSFPPPKPEGASHDAANAVTGEHPVAIGKPHLALWVENVTVSFDGFKALNDLTLTIDKGELRCIIGPNGAGKTTLMDVITGRKRPTTGKVYLESRGIEVTDLPEWRIAQLGVGRKFQRPTVFQTHSVEENLDLAIAGNKGVFYNLFHRQDRAEKEQIDWALETIGLADARKKPAGLLSHGHKQWLEIGMLLVQKPKVLLVDEPVAGMNLEEMEKTAELLKSLAGERTVVVVEHDMDFVRSIAKRVTVLHEGSVLAEGNMDTIQKDPRVIEVYLGA
ncbi:MAG TPA: urea ABC transporter ATP-binding protein UrtD [Polyangiaceae bacterium]|nr:urea ABC transporter ATP-binding protein UrtD [Polyangiaceae bacterium]